VIDNGRASVTFSRFDLDAYALFLRAKQLPEKEVVYDWETDSYTLSTAARFASRLSGETSVVDGTAGLPLAGHLFDYQEFIVRQALEARRFAIWADTGLGKTAMLLEWARQVRDLTGGRVLVLAPTHELIRQHCEEWERFYPEEQWIAKLTSRDLLAEWCGDTSAPDVGIATYALMVPGILPELGRLAGLVADESSILKTGGGTIKWNLIHSSKGIEFKLSCTATPAPNEAMEYASQAAFLEKLRAEGEILWTYFTRDKYGAWSVKPHARDAFYAFMSSWSIYLRDPAAYGFADILATLPPPVITEHRIDLTAEQRAAADEILVQSGRGLFDERQGVRERAKLSQLAKGFLYETGPGSQPRDDRTQDPVERPGPGARAIRRIESLKPDVVARLVRREVRAGRPTIVWTVFDEESDILAGLLAPLRPLALHGSDTDAQRAVALAEFRRRKRGVLISKAQLIGYGLNLQHARAMVFSGFDDSFERLYQAIRRAYRFGQTDTVHVHVPVVPELEGLMLDNLRSKEAAFERDVQIQQANYRRAYADLLPALKEAAA
jgi:hypothetical protein